MNLVNATRMPAAYTVTVGPDGRDSMVVVVKGTFTIPDRPDHARGSPRNRCRRP